MWDNNDFNLLAMLFRSIGKTFAFTWNLFAGLFGRIRLRLTLKGIKSKNDAQRNVEIMSQPLSLAQALGEASPGGKVVISGCDAEKSSPWRNAVTAQTVARVAQSNVGVVVLHAGDDDLIGRLQARIDPVRLVIVNAANKIYDPLRDYDADECIIVLSEGIGDAGDSFRNARIYLEGLILATQYCRKRQPNLEMLRRLSNLSHSKIVEQLEQCLNAGKISQTQYDRVDELLSEGISGRTYTKDYLMSLCMQLRSLIPDDIGFPDAKMTNIGRALSDHKVLILDVKEVTRHKLCYGLLMNELMQAITKYGNGYLVVDNLPISECPEMVRMFTDGKPGLGVCIAEADLFARCGSKLEKMNEVITGSECCIAFKHEEGKSAQAWQEKYGKYRKKDVSWNLADGSMRPGPFTLFPGKHASRGYSFIDKDEYRILEGDIQNLPNGVAIITRQDQDHIVVSGLREE